ncbi:uncharacterized protein DUF664 [Herbihabitans rhizosphaerae]|uniref:Uncharacterized protein DUF664 n=1 Tax=Herbihabitans rhizosphaerae TaxID=1872711 RepID=A0A4Q7L3F0_9PSEU|nr:DinB family protein [Herbihabitans rhizosphaerae]RZS43765.1 uncharacterized protein DUF664 [Herbihabitans rhizosphaerae]
MPAYARTIADETDGLLHYIDQQRLGLRAAAFGVTEEQARLTPTASTLSLGGLIKHVANVERGWMVETVLGKQLERTEEDYLKGFELTADETLEGALAFYDEVARETERIVAEIGDLEYRVQVPDQPWFPKDVEHWTLRWVLLHLIEETARHGGHADIIRESIDGSNFYVNWAAMEGAPAPW